MFLNRFSSFLAFVRSSFHHLLLNGDGFFRGVVVLQVKISPFCEIENVDEQPNTVDYYYN